VRFKKCKQFLNTNIYSYLETSGGQSYNLYLNIVHFFNTSVNLTSVAAYDSCFPALVYNMRCSIMQRTQQTVRWANGHLWMMGLKPACENQESGNNEEESSYNEEEEHYELASADWTDHCSRTNLPGLLHEIKDREKADSGCGYEKGSFLTLLSIDEDKDQAYPYTSPKFTYYNQEVGRTAPATVTERTSLARANGPIRSTRTTLMMRTMPPRTQTLASPAWATQGPHQRNTTSTAVYSTTAFLLMHPTTALLPAFLTQGPPPTREATTASIAGTRPLQPLT
jgi:hypothetical protein